MVGSFDLLSTDGGKKDLLQLYMLCMQYRQHQSKHIRSNYAYYVRVAWLTKGCFGLAETG